MLLEQVRGLLLVLVCRVLLLGGRHTALGMTVEGVVQGRALRSSLHGVALRSSLQGRELRRSAWKGTQEWCKEGHSGEVYRRALKSSFKGGHSRVVCKGGHSGEGGSEYICVNAVGC